MIMVLVVVRRRLLLDHVEFFADVVHDGLNHLLHLALVRLGPDHELRLDERVELVRGQGVELHGAALEGQALLVRVLGYLGRHVVTDLGVEAGNQHKPVKMQSLVIWHNWDYKNRINLRFLHDAGNLLFVGLESLY